MRVACVFFSKPAPTSKVAELFLRFSPQISLRGDRAIFVEIGACRNLYSEKSFELRAQILARKVGYEVAIAMSDSIPHAAALAIHGGDSIECLPLHALVEIADPFHRDSEVRKGVGSLVATFQDLGVKTLGDFRRLPISELISRFGVLGHFCYRRIRNEDFVAWPHWRPEEIIEEKKEFPHFEFYGELDPILFELKNQLDQIFQRLRSRQLRTTKIQVEVTCEKTSLHPNNVRRMSFDFHAPQGNTKGTLRILKERLTREFERNPIQSPIEGITTRILKTVPNPHSQKNVFNNDEEKFEELNSLHNQLVEIIGEKNVYHADLTEDRRPEKSWVRSFRAPHSASDTSIDLTDRIGDRPTYLLKKPIKIEITAGYVHINKRRYRILSWHSNVERITGGWFEKEGSELKNTFERNYYPVEIEGHQRIFVFETSDRQYYLHGYYG